MRFAVAVADVDGSTNKLAAFKHKPLKLIAYPGKHIKQIYFSPLKITQPNLAASGKALA